MLKTFFSSRVHARWREFLPTAKEHYRKADKFFFKATIRRIYTAFYRDVKKLDRSPLNFAAFYAPFPRTVIFCPPSSIRASDKERFLNIYEYLPFKYSRDLLKCEKKISIFFLRINFFFVYSYALIPYVQFSVTC